MYCSVLQKSKKHGSIVFDISYYKAFKKYLVFIGQYPTQSRWGKKFNVTVVVCSTISFLIPGLLQIWISIIENNLDLVMETVPMVVTIIVSMIKLLNHTINRKHFDKLFDLIKEEWELLKDKNEAYILDDITKQGNKLAEAYRSVLLTFLIAFLFLPLSPVVLDVILPLNESRQRQQLFKLEYFIDENEYFYHIYLHSVCCSFVIVIIVVSLDSLYMLIVYHASALFAICGHQIAKATERSDVGENGTTTEQFKQCVITHDKALQFYEIINDNTCNSYFLQVLFNMIGITVTAVQTVMYLHKPEEAIRIGMFLVAQQFHLLVITLPGQVIADYSLDLSNNVYCSIWYQTSTSIQKMLYMVQMRSSKACKLTAGGVYEMNIENFGVTFKTCMSYFTMLLSLKD